MEDEGGRAIIYGLGKRRWAVPARFARFEGVPNPAWQTPESKLLKKIHDQSFISHSDNRRTIDLVQRFYY